MAVKVRTNTKASRTSIAIAGLVVALIVAVGLAAWISEVATNASIGDVQGYAGGPTGAASTPGTTETRGSPSVTTSSSVVPVVPSSPATPRTTLPLPPKVPGMTDCGIVVADLTPTIPAKNATTYECLSKGWLAGAPTRLVERTQTDGKGGAFVLKTYDVLGPGRVRVTDDARQAIDRPQVVTVEECTALVVDMLRATETGCTAVSFG